jgi:hypothetical protein
MTTYQSPIEIELNNLIQQLPTPQYLSSSLTSTQDQYGSVLDDFKKYYILHKKYPDLSEYTQMYSSIKGNLHKLNSDLFADTANIENSIQQLGKLLTQANKDINDEKIMQELLKEKLAIIKSENNGATEMTKNYLTMYNMQYFANLTLFVGIIIISYVTYKVFKKNN